MNRLSTFILISLLLASCNLPQQVIVPSETPEIAPSYYECAWNWGTQSLPELSGDVQSALESAGLTGVTATAEAYGENCVTSSGEVARFATMETDFRLTVETSSVSDTQVLGNLLEQILVVLDQFPPGSTPGPQPGYIGVRFVDGSGEVNLWFNSTDGNAARAEGLHGEDLFSRLQSR